jgi:hypothetical protein
MGDGYGSWVGPRAVSTLGGSAMGWIFVGEVGSRSNNSIPGQRSQDGNVPEPMSDVGCEV